MKKLMEKNWLYAIFLFSFITACIPQAFIVREPPKEGEKIIIYLQPMPQEAQSLNFRIQDISAVRDDGTKIPLVLSVNELKSSEFIGVQKFLASGIIPEGPYRGIAILVDRASVQTEEGDAALLVPEGPVMIDHVFNISKRRAQTLFLSFDPLKSIKDAFNFTPVFALSTEVRELKNLIGYVTNSESDIVSVFNKKTMQVTGSISTGRGPGGLVLDQERGRAYVAVSGDNAIEIIDLLKREVTGRIRLNLGDEPVDLGLTPDGTTLVSVNYGSNSVSIVDTYSMFELNRIKVGEEPVSVIIDPLGLRAYIMNSLSNNISVVDIYQKMLAATIAVEETPVGGAFNRAGDKLYVISRDSPDMLVIDTSSLAVTGRVFIGSGALSIKVDTLTDLILVGKRTGGEIIVIDPFSLMFIDTIEIDGTAAFMAIDDEENTLFVVLPERKMLQKINLISKKVMANTELGGGANSVVVMGER